WGFYDVLFNGEKFKFQRPYGSYVMEQVLFKLSFPAEFHAQTAVECAVKLHPQIKDRLHEIEKINLITHESAIRIISKTGDLHNPADRDHCLQYMVAIGLLTGNLTARLCLMDTLGCGLLALRYPECTKLLGPIVPGTIIPKGVPVPGTQFKLDPVQAAFNIGAMIRWLDFNDTWLAAEWGHPSDNLGGILAIADYVSRSNVAQGKPSLTMKTVLTAMIKAHEIQGVLALENSFNRVGLDHVVLVKVASTAVVAELLGCNREQILNAVSLAWVDGQSLRTYRHTPKYLLLCGVDDQWDTRY
ncbi:unnamed protein product, partial [marine sediment metagenome]